MDDLTDLDIKLLQDIINGNEDIVCQLASNDIQRAIYPNIYFIMDQCYKVDREIIKDRLEDYSFSNIVDLYREQGIEYWVTDYLKESH